MMRQHTRWHWVGMLVVGLLATTIVAGLFPGELRHPNAYLNGTSGDAIKNYFVVEYYARYDTGHRFTGMNYPRGEHVNFPDMQPLLAMPLAWAREAGLPVATYGTGLINLGLLLSLVVAATVLYALLRRLHLPPWYAGLTALLITFLSPQLIRFQGHMSLGYACFVPVQWYCLGRILDAPRRPGWYVALATFNLLIGGLAAYHLAMGSLLLLALVPVLAWQQGWQRSWPVLLRVAITAVVPLLVFLAWLRLTDPITDRPVNPYGLLAYRSTFTGLLTPAEGPVKNAWQYFLQTKDPEFEASSYVGLVGVLVLSFTVLLALRYARRRQWARVVRPTLPPLLRSGLWAASLLLLLAMAFPFFLPGLNGLVWLLGPLKQFRALGRFAWPFYYIVAIYTAYYLYRLWRYLRQHRAPAFATSWLAPLLLLWGLEASWHVRPIAEHLEQNRVKEAFAGEAGNYRELLSWTAYKPTDFQALLPLPFFMIGTDKIALEGSGQSVYQAYKASLNLHLPLLTLFSARSSVGESLRLTQLLSGPLVPKELLPALPSPKPLLLLVTPDALTPAEQRLVSLGQKIASSPNATLYALPLAALGATTLAAERAKAAALLPTLMPHDGRYTTTGKRVLYLPFADSPDRRGRLAPGAFHESSATFSTLYNGPLPEPADTGRYEASVWVNARTAYGLGNLQVKLYRKDEQVEHQAGDTRHSTELIGDWVRVAVSFRRPPGIDRLEVLYENQDLLADDLLVRPLDTNVYWRDSQGRLVLNGYPLSY